MAKKTVTEIQTATYNGFQRTLRNAKFDKYNGISPLFAPRKAETKPQSTVRYSLNGLTKMNAALPEGAKVIVRPTSKKK